MNEEKITLGENLKMIRKELNLRQSDIAGGEITRNLVSLIENNRTPLYERNANLIAKNMNQHLEERNSKIFISSKDLMHPERYTAKKKSEQIIKELRERIFYQDYEIEEEYLQEIEAFLKNWSIPEKKSLICELLSDIYYYVNNREKEYFYLNRALENHFSNNARKDIHKVFLKLIANCIDTEKYTEAKRLYNLNIIKTNTLSNRDKAIFYYNKSLLNKKLNLRNEALQIINEHRNLFNEENKEQLFYILIIEGNCLREEGNIKKALTKFNEALELSKDDFGLIGLAYINILDLYRKTNNTEMMKKYVDLIVKELTSFSNKNKYLSRIHYYIAMAESELNNNDSAEDYYISSIGIALSNNEKDRTFEISSSLLKFYQTNDMLDKILKNKELFIQVFSQINETNENEFLIQLFKTLVIIDKPKEAQNLINNIIKKEAKNES